MQVVNVTVILIGYPAGQQLQVPDRSFYQQLFFNPYDGLAAYWLKQTDNDILLDGQVLEWAWINDPSPILKDRHEVLNAAIADMEHDRKLSFAASDVIVLVLAAPAGIPSDGGSTTVRSAFRSHPGIVAREGDRFDFFAHELGHALGLQHSFGDYSFKLPTAKPGEYGHPYCIMSAMAYGGVASAVIPAQPRDKRKEYTGLGPNLNAATALGRGWIDATVYELQGGQPTDVVLRSRAWGGRNPHMPPQALVVRAPNGQDFVVEYRENIGWDAGPPSAVVISQGHGSSADIANPNTHAATFLRSLPIPLDFADSRNVYNGPGFAIEVLDRYAAVHTVRLRVVPGHANFARLLMTSSVDIVDAVTTEQGSTTFAQGETWCVEGTWRYERRSRSQKASFTCAYTAAVAPVRAAWHVNGVPIASASGTVVLRHTTVKLANARLHDQSAVRDVELRYDVVPLPTGSSLHLYNRPQDETFSIDATCALATDVGSGTATESARFEGIRFEYPQEFYDKRNRCMFHVADRVPQYKVALSADGWRRVPEERFDDVRRLLDKLALTVGDVAHYDKVASALKEVLAVTTLDVHIARASPPAHVPKEGRGVSSDERLDR